MNLIEQAKNKALQVAGIVKETTGRVVGNQDLELRGQTDQAAANLRQAALKARSAVKSVGRAFKI